MLTGLPFVALLALVGAVRAAGSPAAAELQYLHHSSWVVRTATHVLVFDYVESLPQGTALAPELKLAPDDLAGERRVVVFASHAHPDHFAPVVREWARTRPGIQYVIGWPEPALPGAKVLRARESWSSGGLQVSATGSTDEGVGFLVTVDGLTLFHAGDLARWSDASEEAFSAEIAWLKTLDRPIDIALFPIATGVACDPRPSIRAGVRAAAAALRPRVLLPMHVACPDRLDLYESFRAEAAGELPASQVLAPARVGETFRYEHEYEHETGTLVRVDEQAAVSAVLQRLMDAAGRREPDEVEALHLWGPKFSKFDDKGLGREDAEAARAAERKGLLGVESFRGAVEQLKVDVFGGTAVATFVLDWSVETRRGPASGKDRSTVVLTKDGGAWKIVHEHYSPLAGGQREGR